MKKTNLLASSALAAALLATLAPATAQATYYGHGQRPVTVYFTRHAEKQTTTTALGPATSAYELIYNEDNSSAEAIMTNQVQTVEEFGSKLPQNRDDVCGEEKCAEELSDLGELRAELLSDFFRRTGITGRLDKVVSSHKVRTFQTVAPTAEDAGLSVLQVPADGTELEPEGTTPSECPTLDEIRSAAPGDTVLVAGHSGTLYDIMGDGNKDCDGLGLDTSNDNRFPKDSKGKVRDFGDVWKVQVYPNGQARFSYRINLQPKALFVKDIAR